MDKENLDNQRRNLYMLDGPLACRGYDWWWHSFTGHNAQTGEERSFFIEYFVMNPGEGQTRPVFGMNGQNTPSYGMVKAGCWGPDAKQLHRFFGSKMLNISRDELRFVAGDCFLSDDLLRGNVEVSSEDLRKHPEYMCDYGSMSWQLRIRKTMPFNVGYGASKPFRDANLFEMFWHVSGMRCFLEGTVFMDGVEYTVTPETSYGYADKNWGCDYTNPWVWLSSCNVKSLISGKKLKDTAFDIGGGCPKVGPMSLGRRLLICFYYEGERFEFNFSKLHTGCETKYKCYETDDRLVWRIRASCRGAAIEVDAQCLKTDMLLINYENPDGFRRHDRLWNGGTAVAHIRLYRTDGEHEHLIDHMEARNCGCEYGAW